MGGTSYREAYILARSREPSESTNPRASLRRTVEPRPQPFDLWWKQQHYLLSPGERVRSATLDLEAVGLERIDSPTHARFAEAYDILSAYFAPRSQLEGVEVLSKRLSTPIVLLTREWAAQYEMLILTHGRRIIGVRDHLFFTGPKAAAQTPIYQAHIFIVPDWRGTGLAAWLRALPLISASWWQEKTIPRLAHPSLIAEIDRPRTAHEDAARVLRGYVHAGYGVLPPGIDYLQPDVPPGMTSASAGACSATPMHLALRFVGKEFSEPRTGEEIALCVEALYALHETEFPNQNLEELWQLQARIRSLPSIWLLHDGEDNAISSKRAR